MHERVRTACTTLVVFGACVAVDLPLRLWLSDATHRPGVVRTLAGIDGFAFDVELLFLCDRFGLKVKEVPVVWRNSERSTVNVVGAPPKMLLDVLRVRWRFRRGLYNP